MKQTKVLIVDDSALMRELLQALLSRDPGIHVVGTAADPFQARQMIKQLLPDVITLDIEMPKMDGLSFLEKIMTLRPMPVVMVSSLTQAGAEATITALELGAVDFFPKPKLGMQKGIEKRADELISKVKSAAGARVKALQKKASVLDKSNLPPPVSFSTTEKIIAIGASTGGVEALREIICRLPANSPAVLVTQHMPEKFTQTFAERLNKVSAVSVSEARQDERVLPGHVYIAPGNKHLKLKRSGANYICQLSDTPPVSGHRPSVDVLFSSTRDAAGKNAVGVILTGMGKDGASGLLELRQAGAKTFGQDESSSVVYGMPKAAFEMGAVEQQLPLHLIAEAILNACGSEQDRHIRV
ncbi:protein-glutamate methylesterase/protein-glutamine glutaminase [Kiloniella laminariae]|uniref:protein-glutamate methylesterase/protein-glutamine glutaminase n=1 Tax=Kiloniella laminariae TaxID=454162 RepID=UPI0003A85A33|nr:chemotaxis response regulator protein-glutamate methylesterase [Kiloniella laminariae]